MNDALTIINYIFSKFINLMFNDLQMFSGVSIGWVLVVITIFSIMIRNILSVAKSSNSIKVERGENGR